MNNQLAEKIGDLLCDHYDKLPCGVDITSLRLAMREIAHVGHLGCRQRCDSVSCIGEIDDEPSLYSGERQPKVCDFVSDRESKSV